MRGFAGAALVLMLYGSLFGLPPEVAATPELSENRLGFNWPFGHKVYVKHWDQYSVCWTPNNNCPVGAHRPFMVARNGTNGYVRLEAGDVEVYNHWKNSPTEARDRLRQMLDDANTYNVKVVLTNRLSKSLVEALAGTTYASVCAASDALVTSGSTPWNNMKTFLQSLIVGTGAPGTQSPGLTTHPALYSWEALNEPAFFLGRDYSSASAPDCSQVSNTEVADWVNQTQLAMKSYAKQIGSGYTLTINGGDTHYTQYNFGDADFRKAHWSTDILDMHFYEYNCATNVDTCMTQLSTDRNRINSLNGTLMDAIIGEYGTVTTNNWFREMSNRIRDKDARPWLRFGLAWGFDAADAYKFNDKGQRSYVIGSGQGQGTLGFNADAEPESQTAYMDHWHDCPILFDALADFTRGATGGAGSYQWFWTFPDGNPSTSTQQNPQNVVWSSLGVRTVVLRVTDSGGNVTFDHVSVSVVHRHISQPCPF